MGNDIKTSQPAKGDQLGITFNEIHSDEPHEAVSAEKTEVAQKHTSTISSHISGSEVFNVAKGLESGHIDMGTIVSDKKDARPSLGQNILSAFSEWWGSAKNTIDESTEKMQTPILGKKPEPVVSKVETRAEVVKTAATHATLAPKDDHHIVIQKIRTFKQDVARVQNAAVVVKDESVKKGGWTHTNEQPTPEPKKEEAVLAHTPQKANETTPVIPAPIVPHKQDPAPLQTPVVPTQAKNTPPTNPPVPTQPINKSTTVTELKHEAPPIRPTTNRMSVPDMVVKKEVSLPKKNIWVAPRIQPESSVLAPHSTPAPVSQSFIPTQATTVTKPPTVITAPPTPNVPPLETKTAPEIKAEAAPLIPSTQPVMTTSPQAFHSTSTPATPAQPKGEEKATSVAPRSDVSQSVHIPKPIAPPTLPVQTLPKPIDVTVTQEVKKETPTPILPQTNTAVSPTPVPVPNIPKPTVPPPAPIKDTPAPILPKQDVVVPTKPATPTPVQETSVPQPKPRITPPQIIRPTLYKKALPESQTVPGSGWATAKASTPTPPSAQQQTFVPRPQEVPPQAPQQSVVAPDAETRIPEATPPIREVREDIKKAPEPVLPRPLPPQPEREVVEPEFEIPRTPEVRDTEQDNVFQTPSPSLPSRPITPPPLTRTIVSPVPENSAVPKQENKAFRTFVKWAILSCIALLGVALALFASIYFNVFKKDTPKEEAPVTVPTFIETGTQTPLMLEGTKEVFLQTLKDQVSKAPTGLTQFYPTMKAGEITRPGSTAEILSFLNTHLDDRTKKSLSPTIMIGSITTTKNEPFIVLQSTNFDVLFTGLLAWEPTMYADFAPLFGEATQSSFKFKDAVRDNTSTRILYDEAGNEVLLYSFINQKTVVITTSGEALSELIKKF